MIKINDESPTVKRLILKIEDKNFSFKPGQWYVPYLYPKYLDDRPEQTL